MRSARGLAQQIVVLPASGRLHSLQSRSDLEREVVLRQFDQIVQVLTHLNEEEVIVEEVFQRCERTCESEEAHRLVECSASDHAAETPPVPARVGCLHGVQVIRDWHD